MTWLFCPDLSETIALLATVIQLDDSVRNFISYLRQCFSNGGSRPKIHCKSVLIQQNSREGAKQNETNKMLPEMHDISVPYRVSADISVILLILICQYPIFNCACSFSLFLLLYYFCCHLTFKVKLYNNNVKCIFKQMSKWIFIFHTVHCDA